MQLYQIVKINTSNIEEEALTFSVGDHFGSHGKIGKFFEWNTSRRLLSKMVRIRFYIEPGNTDVLIASDKAPIVKATIRNAFL